LGTNKKHWASRIGCGYWNFVSACSSLGLPKTN
ncbi:unnamed protein product, partial [Allacma fusca]